MKPDDLSAEKLFPRVINKIVELTIGMCYGEAYKERILTANAHLKDQMKIPEVEIPDDRRLNISLAGVLVEKRSGHRRQRRFCKGRKTWTTYRKIPGAAKLLQN